METNKLYTTHQIYVSTFIGSAIAGGWLATQNAKRLGLKNPAVYLIAGILLTTIISIIAWAIPIPKEFPNIIIPLVIAIIAKLIIEATQGKKIKEEISAGKKPESWWKVIGITIIGFIIALASMFVIYYAYNASS